VGPWTIAILVFLTLVGIAWLLTNRLYFHNRNRWDFARRIHTLALTMENGGVLHVQHQGSDVRLDFVRESGSDESAEIVLSVPKAEWSIEALPRLRKIFEMQEFNVRFSPDVPDTTVSEMRFYIPDIWDEACGSSVARAAHLVLDALPLPEDARFRIAFKGRGAGRLRDRYLRNRPRDPTQRGSC
jgi:hypothetical protein